MKLGVPASSPLRNRHHPHKAGFASRLGYYTGKTRFSFQTNKFSSGLAPIPYSFWNESSFPPPFAHSLGTGNICHPTAMSPRECSSCRTSSTILAASGRRSRDSYPSTARSKCRRILEVMFGRLK